MARKSFKTASPRAAEEFDINGEVFHFVGDIPGAILIDFLAMSDMENPTDMARILKDLFQQAIVPEDYERFNAYITSRENNVTLELLAEIAGYITESVSGNEPQPELSGVG